MNDLFVKYLWRERVQRGVHLDNGHRGVLGRVTASAAEYVNTAPVEGRVRGITSVLEQSSIDISAQMQTMRGTQAATLSKRANKNCRLGNS